MGFAGGGAESLEEAGERRSVLLAGVFDQKRVLICLESCLGLPAVLENTLYW